MLFFKRVLPVLLILLQPVQSFSDQAVEQCQQKMQIDFEEYLTDLSLLEASFRKLVWQHAKYRDMVYNPLWQAVQDADLTHKERYEHLAQVYFSETTESESALIEILERMAKRMTEPVLPCRIPQFSQCFTEWRDPRYLLWQEFQKLIQDYLEEQAQLNQDVRISLEDSVSDHQKLAERDFLVAEKWHKETYPKFHTLLRQVREGIEWQWPAERCCSICSGKAVADFESQKFDHVRGHELATNG